MKFPILAYGHSILKQRCIEIDKNFPDLDLIIKNMWETMDNASGCGLAAPQIGQAIRIFVVDSRITFESLAEEYRKIYCSQFDKGIKEVFINAQIIDRSDDLWEDDEGCLSIPNLSWKVKRNWTITIEYNNQRFEKKICSFSGITARMIQHEYDHVEGVLYLDYLKPLTRKLMEPKLKKILKGQIIPNYPMKFV